tara:strand:- start:9687 stop:11189 length:1503 start_codon:yes stop_codon:yes gene_type:complete
MPIETSANLGLEYLMPAQAQKHVTVNESFRLLDALVQMVVASRTVTVEPELPEDGDIYIIPVSATGDAWGSMAVGQLAYFRDQAWIAIPPKTGWRCWVADEGLPFVFDGTQWIIVETPVSTLQNLDRLGVGTTADETNPFSAKLNSVLWTALGMGEGGTGDLRYVMNKESESDILSILLQSGWSGRAEIGLVGDNDLLVKVSDDGSTWREALRLDRQTGLFEAPAGVQTSTLNSGPLGGQRNILLNGSLDIWTRGDSQAVSGYGSADRFCFSTDDPAFSSSRQPLAAGEITAPLQNFLRISKPGSGTFCYFYQRVENVRQLAGQAVTLSFWARTPDATSINDIGLYQFFGSGGSPKVFTTIATSINPGATWQRVTIAASLPDIAGKTIGSGDYLEVFFNLFPVGAAAGSLDIAGLQLEPGRIATPFEHWPPAQEKQLCGRYFQARTLMAENGSRHVPLAPMRAVPTVSASAGSVSGLTTTGFELAHSSAVAVTITADAEI